MKALRHSARALGSGESSLSNDHPRPPWPTSSSAVRVNHPSISISDSPFWTWFEMAVRNCAKWRRSIYHPIDLARWVKYPVCNAVKEGRHMTHMVNVENWRKTLRTVPIYEAIGHSPGFRIFRCWRCSSPARALIMVLNTEDNKQLPSDDNNPFPKNKRLKLTQIENTIRSIRFTRIITNLL